MAPKKAYYDKWNSKNVKLLKRHQKEIMDIYQEAFLNSYEQLIIATMDDDKYNEKAYFKAKMAYINQINDKLNDLQERYNIQTSDYYKQCIDDFFNIEGEFSDDKKYQEFKNLVNKKVDVTNEKVINLIKSGRIYEPDENGNFIDLSNRLWNASVASGKKLQDAILSCFAQGMGPADMAKVIEEFGKEGHRKWDRKKVLEKLGPGYARSHAGSLDYAALRLARTTHTHVNQLRIIELEKVVPYADKVKYHSSHSGNRTCELCKERDGKVYPNNKVPLDHPNGMCWLEPVFNMSEDEMAKDLAKWVRGEPNSGIMDKAYPNLKGTEDYKPGKPPAKKTPAKKTTSKKTTSKKNTLEKNIDAVNKQIDDYIKHWTGLNKQGKAGEKYLSDMKEILKLYPKDILDAYCKINNKINRWTSGGGAYYHRSAKSVNFTIEKALGDAKKYNRGTYDVWFHENGHAMDHILSLMASGTKKTYQSKVPVLSTKTSFIKALKEDFENQKIMLRRKYLKEKGYTEVDQMSESKLKQRIPDKNLNALYNHYLRDNHKTAGIQDVVEGMSNAEIHILWGHGKEYWNRGNREHEYASEAWANILGSYSDQETYELMKKYFPKAMKEQEKIIKAAMKEITKYEESGK